LKTHRKSRKEKFGYLTHSVQHVNTSLASVGAREQGTCKATDFTSSGTIQFNDNISDKFKV
jgi:hypothetical protein